MRVADARVFRVAICYEERINHPNGTYGVRDLGKETWFDAPQVLNLSWESLCKLRDCDGSACFLPKLCGFVPEFPHFWMWIEEPLQDLFEAGGFSPYSWRKNPEARKWWEAGCPMKLNCGGLNDSVPAPLFLLLF